MACSLWTFEAVYGGVSGWWETSAWASGVVRRAGHPRGWEGKCMVKVVLQGNCSYADHSHGVLKINFKLQHSWHFRASGGKNTQKDTQSYGGLFWQFGEKEGRTTTTLGVVTQGSHLLQSTQPMLLDQGSPGANLHKVLSFVVFLQWIFPFEWVQMQAHKKFKLTWMIFQLRNWN